jgi:predicted RNA-binding Zn-ribbon protein involved in translation (DUF1610 family)
MKLHKQFCNTCKKVTVHYNTDKKGIFSIGPKINHTNSDFMCVNCGNKTKYDNVTGQKIL